MKRRDLLRNFGIGAGAAVLGGVPQFDLEAKESIPNFVVGKNSLENYSVSKDINDFDISISEKAKSIDIIPKNKFRPRLDMRTYHRYIMDMCDQPVGGYLLDITSGTPQYRITDYYIDMANGWQISSRGKRALYGAVREGNSLYAVLQILGTVDYELTRNIVIKDELGNIHQHDPSGMTTVYSHSYNSHHKVTIEWEAYKNSSVSLSETTGEVLIKHGAWNKESYWTTISPGIIPVPIMSMG